MSDLTSGETQNQLHPRLRLDSEQDIESRLAALQARFDEWSVQLRQMPFDTQIGHFELRDVLLLRITHAADLLRCCSKLEDTAWLAEWPHVERAVYRAEQAFAQLS